MAIELKKIGVAAGWALVDYGLEQTGFALAGYPASDIWKIISTIGGYFMNYMGYYPDVTETIFIASLPSTIKLAINYVKGMMPAGKAVATKKLGITVQPIPEVKRKQLEFIGIR